MLQNNKIQTAIEENQPAGGGQQGLAEIVDWGIGLLRRQYLVVLFVGVLCVGAGYIYIKTATPIYTAKTSLYLGGGARSPVAQTATFGNDNVEIVSQIQIIKSAAIAQSIINNLQLMNDPEFNPSGKAGMDELIASVEQGLTVEPMGGRVIVISYDSRSPVRAAQLANAVAKAYINDQLEAKYEANSTAGRWLQERVQQLHEQSDISQRAVETFKKQNNIVATEGKSSLDDQQIELLNSQLVAARAQASDKLARLNQLQAIIRLGPSDQSVNAAISEATTPLTTTLRQQYLELARRESEWSARFGHDHLAVVNLRNRMREIRQSMFDELQRAAEIAKNDYQIAVERQQEIEKQLASSVAQSQETSQAQITLRGLQSTAAGYRSLYENFLQQYMGTVQQASFPFTEARVISAALPPSAKSKPKSKLIIALSGFGGIGLGLGLALLRDMMDRVFRTTNQLETALQVPCIALVPLLKDAQKQRPLSKEMAANVQGQKTVSTKPGPFWTVIDSPLSSFAEAIRSIKVALDLHMPARACKVIGFTSTLPNEGKSTVAAALAHVVAQGRSRVLLVDCDLRNPSLTRTLAPAASIGIVDVLSGRNSISEAIFKEPKTNMALLPTGKKIARFLTSEILAGDAIIKLFDVLRQNYDYILVDLPPLLPIVDVRASTQLIDSYVMIVEWGRTKIDLVEQGLKSAPKIYDGLIGTVLNKADINYMTRYDSSGRYAYHEHYSRYGYLE